MDNILVHQKNTILGLVWDEKFDQALSHLELVKELWDVYSYSYKYREIRQIIIDRVRQKWIEADHWKVEQKWKNYLDNLTGASNGMATQAV